MAALLLEARGADCAEYVAYRLQGVPALGTDKKNTKLRAMIGTFYANLQIGQSLDRRK